MFFGCARATGAQRIGHPPSAKLTVGTEKDAIAKVSVVVDAGGKVKPGGASDGEGEGKGKSLEVGESVTATKSMQLGNDMKSSFTGSLDITDTIGGHSSSTSASGEEVGLAVEGGLGVVFGGEIGATKEGWSALADAFSQAKDAVFTPPPPPPPPPVPPPSPTPNVQSRAPVGP